MKLVILPGLDGSGKLFQPLLEKLPSDIEALIIPYPDNEPLGYLELEQYVLQRLPSDQEYILLAESFAGPLGYLLARRELPNMVALIFVATFLRNPNPRLVSLAQHLPMSLFLKMRMPKFIMRRFLLGHNATAEMMKLLGDVLLELDPKVFMYRLNEVARPPEYKRKITIPCYYIQTTNDRLVMADNVDDFNNISDSLQVRIVKGSHFILQSNPMESAKAIMGAVEDVQQAV